MSKYRAGFGQFKESAAGVKSSDPDSGKSKVSSNNRGCVERIVKGNAPDLQVPSAGTKLKTDIQMGPVCDKVQTSRNQMDRSCAHFIPLGGSRFQTRPVHSSSGG
ncbi:MAG: hypothetical protein C4519_26780 [Desulfobacteraceae bacterium]|nr:MAG: hypothetical protein C4519_26780 [Desulfobacteraceae bacterium]